jgi:hypothetical protein
LFCLYTESLEDQVHACNVDCQIFCINICIFLYADDIVLLAPTITVLLMLLNASENELDLAEMIINTENTIRIWFEPEFEAKCKSLTVVMSLLRSKCLPCWVYATEACPLLSRDKHSFKFTVTRTFVRIFSTRLSTVNFSSNYYPLPIKLILGSISCCNSLQLLRTIFVSVDLLVH